MAGEIIDTGPNTALALLGERVRNLSKDKEALERALERERDDRRALEIRVATMERSFQRGAGALLVLPIIGTAIGILVSYGKAIFAPWTAH